MMLCQDIRKYEHTLFSRFYVYTVSGKMEPLVFRHNFDKIQHILVSLAQVILTFKVTKIILKNAQHYVMMT